MAFSVHYSIKIVTYGDSLNKMESPPTLGFKITGEQSIERMAPLTFEASFSNFQQQQQFISQSEQVFKTVNCNRTQDYTYLSTRHFKLKR